MFAIRPTTRRDLDAVADLLSRLPGRTSALACGVDRLSPDWLAGSFVAERHSGVLVGFLGVQVRPEQGRAWLHGPFLDLPIRHPAAAALWDRTADALLNRIKTSPPLAGCHDIELFGYVEHRLLVAFAARHGFAAEPRTRVVRLSGRDLRVVLVRAADDAEASGPASIEPVAVDSPRWAEVTALHTSLARGPFGDHAAAQPLTAWSGECTVVAALDAGRVVGYAAGGVTPHECTIDTVGVRPQWRGRGHGRALVTALLRELTHRHGARAAACATIRRGDTAAERLFATSGFRPTAELTPYRRAW